MDDTLNFIRGLFQPQEQWPMSYAGSEEGLSLPEIHPTEIATGEPTDIDSLSLSVTDTPDNIVDLIQTLLANTPRETSAVPADITNALNKLLGDNTQIKAKAQKDLYLGAVMKTVAAASDFFNRAVGIAAGQPKNIRDSAEIAAQNYDNQMAALDNQVLYIKHQLADRFNKTIENNIMSLAAKNIRVNAGNVLELSKEQASEITEDMREAESNARLKKIALEAGKKSSKEAANYAIKQMWTGLLGSAVNLGLAVETAGGTGESWGDLYKGYKKGKDVSKAIKGGTLTSMYE